MDETIIDKYKKLKGKVVGLVMKVKGAIAFFMTPVGWVVGILILVLAALVLIYLGFTALGHQLGIWLHDDYAGISTPEDYDVIVASISATGYDSFITEEKWQEYAAFEYAVLMDVAEYIHDNQDFYINALNEDDTEYKDEAGNPVLTNAVFPEGIVHTQYNHDKLSVEHWREYAVDGQYGIEHDLRSEAPETKEPNGGDRKMLGGNREVITPRLIYEVANNDYEDESFSWMPYIMVVREDLELNYFLASDSLDRATWKEGLKGEGNGYGGNLEEIDFKDKKDAVKKDLEAIRTSPELNRFNYTMPSSAYLKDLKKIDKERAEELGLDPEDAEVLGVQDPVSFVIADRYDQDDTKPYGDVVYYIEQPTHIVYKIPLRTLINRYIPKATLLTTWYTLKPDDDAEFDIDELMKVIKEIYAAACYDAAGKAKEIEITGGRDKYGEIIKLSEGTIENQDKLPPDNKLRVAETKVNTEGVEGVLFKEDGKIGRDAQTRKAQQGTQQIMYGETNYSTMVYFQQYGLETSRYEKYKVYLGNSGDYEPYSGDEARPSFETASANYLTRERVNMIEALNFTLHDITFINEDGEEVDLSDLPVKFRTAYNIISGEGGDDYEDYNKLKFNELYPNNPKLKLAQEEPEYEFMKNVVRKAEEYVKESNGTDSSVKPVNIKNEEVGLKVPEEKVVKYSGDSADNEKVLDHKFTNTYYIPATVANYKKLLEKYKTDYKIVQHIDEIEYKLPEDFRFFNQDPQKPIEDPKRMDEEDDRTDYTIDHWIPHWYDFKELEKTNETSWEQVQANLENAYLRSFFDFYKEDGNKMTVKEMLVKELEKQGYHVKDGDPNNVLSYAHKEYGYEKDVEYTSKVLAPVYVTNSNRATLNSKYGGNLTIEGSVKSGTHNPNMKDVMEGDYRVNYYWTTLYNMKVRRLEMRQKIYHRRMPVLFVRYAETWGKSMEYIWDGSKGKITMNPLNYRNFRYLIPDSINSLGLADYKLYEKADYRTNAYTDFFKKSSEAKHVTLKEADILDMLAHWEKYGDESNEVGYAYMRELYKLVIEIRDSGKLLDSSYTFLYVPYTVTNYKDATLQEVFWFERLGVTQGEDELTEDEQKVTRTKGLDVRWQNVEYAEYWECIEDEGDKERVKMYALFPFGSPYIRAYIMVEGLNGGGVLSQGFGGEGANGEAGHSAIDICSRENIRSMYFRADEQHEKIYYYELNRLTLKNMRAGNTEDDAFHLAESVLNSTMQNHFMYSPIVAVLPGIVTAVKYDARSGFQVEIYHPNASYNKAMEEFEEKQTELNKFDMDAWIDLVKEHSYARTFYCHFKRWPLVDIGDSVGAGTILGYEGTTGRSTGYHLHFEMGKTSSDGANAQAVDPVGYTTPLFRPFYYDEKASKIVEEQTDTALGSEYYNLERTILPDFGLAESHNVINGKQLKDGTTISYSFPAAHSGYYTSGDVYADSKEYTVYWGNDVGDLQPLVDDKEDFWDLYNLNKKINYHKGDEDTPNGEKIAHAIPKKVYVNAPPKCFEKNNLPEEPDWYLINIAEYKSPRVIPHYNGPRKAGEKITEEGRRDLLDVQISFRKAGFYSLAEVDFKSSDVGEYSDDFITVINKVQEVLKEKGYKVGGAGELDDDTISSYNTYIQYLSSKKDKQDLMVRDIGYNAGEDLSFETELVRAIIKKKSQELSLLEKGEFNENGKKLFYSGDKKTYYKKQGLYQISIEKAIERYKEDNVKDYEAVLFIRQPLRNSKIGTEMIKEYEMYFYENYSGDITKAKNGLVYKTSGAAGGKWKEYFEEIEDTIKQLKKDGVLYQDIQLLGTDQTGEDEKMWFDADYFERLIVYALAIEAYEQEDPEKVNVQQIIQSGPTGLGAEVIEEFKDKLKEKIGKCS